VSLSSLASTLQGSEKPPVNAARLQEIKDAIAQGRFKINPEAIAERLIETARDLVNVQRRA
jgi:negative regulator of flagellin synthesis FlgM